MSPEEFRALDEGTLDRMVKAGWISRYTYAEKSGVKIQWTNQGRETVAVLKELVTMLDLCAGPHNASAFDLQACKMNRGRMPAESGSARKLAWFWRQCMKALNLSRDDYDFHSLVHVVAKYGPDKEASEAWRKYQQGEGDGFGALNRRR